MPCEAANDLLIHPLGKRLGAGEGGRSSSVELCTSPEVACERYARVANWYVMLIGQRWPLGRKETVPSKYTGGKTSRTRRSSHDHRCTEDWRPSYRYRPLVRPPADSVGRSETYDRSDGKAHRDTMLLSLRLRALSPCPIFRMTQRRRRSISCAMGGQPAGNWGYTWFSRSTPLLLRTRYVVSKGRDPVAEQISHSRSHTRKQARLASTGDGPGLVWMKVVIRHDSHPFPDFSAAPPPGFDFSPRVRVLGTLASVPAVSVLETARCHRHLFGLADVGFQRAAGRRICTQYTQVSPVPRSGPSGTPLRLVKATEAPGMSGCYRLTLPPTFLPLETDKGGGCGPHCRRSPSPVTTRRTVIRTRGCGNRLPGFTYPL